MSKLTRCSEPIADRAMATCNSSKHRGAVGQGGPGGAPLCTLVGQAFCIPESTSRQAHA